MPASGAEPRTAWSRLARSGISHLGERPPDPGVRAPRRKKCWLHAHTGRYTLLEIRCAARARARLQALLRAGACSGAAQLRASPGGREGAPHLLMLSRRLHRVPAGGTLRMRPGTFLYLDGALRTPGSSGAKGSGGAGGGAAVAAM